LRAFDVNAIDYVLKPFTDARLRRAIARTRDWLGRQEPGELERRLVSLLATVRGTTPHPARIRVRRDESIFFVPVVEIRWIEAAGNIMRLHTAAGIETVRTTISALAEQLDPTRFVRVHRSAIINLDFVKEIQPWFHGEYLVILTDGQQVRVGRRYRDGLLRPLI
jgi:two-component system LytT family response regulator